MSALSCLIVEDEVLLQMQLSFALEDAGYEVAAMAASKKQAYEAIDARHVDLALVDVHLADGPTGLDVGRKLAASGVPFMFLTANAARIPADFCGGWGVIGKPYSEQAIASVLAFVEGAIRRPPPSLPAPAGIQLSPGALQVWSTR